MATATRSTPRPSQPPGKRQRLDSLKNPQRRSLSSLLTSRQGIQAGPESAGQCPTCQDNDVGEEDGHIVCHACGTVISESNIVSEIQFAETSGGGHLMIGQHVGSDQAHARSGLLGLKNAGGSNSREHSLANGRRYINQIGAALSMSDSLTKGAMNVYTLAVANNFIQGRQTRSVAAVCLYIATRLLDTNSNNSRNIAKFMLIDFADILQLNVFKLGHIYKDLVDELRLNGPNYQIRPLNPENLIHRFAEKLEFDKDQETAVAIDAVRILQRMNRDWMTPGRRPAGVCGAALIIAARMHNYRRTVREMVYVAKVTEATLVKRLEEFKRTESSGLTVEEFRRIDLERFCDPPSFYEQDLDKTRKRRKQRHVEFDDDGGDDAESQDATPSPAVNVQLASPAPTQQQTQFDSQNMPPPPPAGTSTPTSSTKRKRGRPPKARPSAVGMGGPSASLLASTEAPLEPDITTAMSDPSSLTHASALTQVLDSNAAPASPPATQGHQTQNTGPVIASTEEISDSEFGVDTDLQACLLAPTEVEIKTRIWTHENRDWIKAEHAKELKRKIAEVNGTLPNVKRRKRRRTRMGDMASYHRENQEGGDDDDIGEGDGEEDNMPAGSPAEAVAKMLKKRAYSKKINYEFLQEIYQPSSQGSSASGSRRQSMSAASDAAASPGGGDIPAPNKPTAAVERTPPVGTARPEGTEATLPGGSNVETETERPSPEALDDIQEIAREEQVERSMLDPGRMIGLPDTLDEDEAEGEEDEPGDYVSEEDDAAEDDDDDDEDNIEDILRNAKDKAGVDDEYDY